MAEIVSLNEWKMKKGYEEMGELKACGNYEGGIVIARKKNSSEGIRKSMVSGYIRMLTEYNTK